MHDSESPAYLVHDDAADPAVLLRVHGMLTLGGAPVTLKQLKACVDSDAANGRDPFASGTVEVGLLLELDQYEALVEYAKGREVTYGTRKKGKRNA